MADKPTRRIGSIKKPAPPAPPAAPAAPPLPTQEELDAGLSPGSMAFIDRLDPETPEFLPTGTVLTEFEKDGLKRIGVDTTKPIPTDIAAKLAAHQAAMAGPVPYHPDVRMDHVLVRPPVIDISQASPEKLREIDAALSAYADMVKSPGEPPTPRAASAPIPPTPPRKGGVEFVDDIGPGRATASPQPPARPATPSPTATGPVPPSTAPPPEGAGGLLHPAECPHCGHDLAKADDTPITDGDKINFVQAILGGQRFKQERLLFGGRLKLVFRSLTSRETDMAFRQIVVDAQSDLKSRMVNDTPFYWRNLMTYRMLMSIEKVESDVSGTIEVPPIEDIETDPVVFPDTKLMAVFDALVEQVCPTEQLRSIIGHAYNEFQAVCDKLQVMAEQPDFWKAIG